MSAKRDVPPPGALLDDGLRSWRSIVSLCGLSPSELETLWQACQTADLIAALSEVSRSGGATVKGLDWGGDGDARKYAALEYLDRHPDTSMPFGEYGDALAVIRRAIELKGGYEPPRGSWGPPGPVIGTP